MLLAACILPFLGLVTGTHELLNYDDKINITENTYLTALNRENLHWMLTSHKLGVYEPISWLIKAVVYALFGLSARAFHVTTLLFHWLNVLLLYACFSRILHLVLLPNVPTTPRPFASAAGELQGRIQLVSAVSVLVYAIHPLRVEVVAWASGQSYAVGTAFLLASILAYLRSQRPPTAASAAHNALPPKGETRAAAKAGRRQQSKKSAAVNTRRAPPPITGGAGSTACGWLALSVLLYVAATFGKSAMVVLPAWIVLLDLFVLRRRDYWRIGLEKLPYIVLMLATIVTVTQINEAAMAANNVVLSWPEKSGRAVMALVLYPLEMLWPPNLTPFYAMPVWGIEIWQPAPLLALLALLALSTAAVRVYRRYPWPLIILTAYGVALLPVLGFVQHGTPALTADRYTYLGSLPLHLALAGGWLHWQTGKALRRPLLLLLSAICLIFTWITVKQVGYWRDDRTIWVRALQIQPANPFAGNNLGFKYYEEKNYPVARKYLELAHLADPKDEFPMINLGVTYYELGRCDLAIEHYLQAMPDHKSSHGLFNNLGNCYVKLGQDENALPHYRRAIALQANPQAQQAMQRVLERLRQKK